MNENHDKLKAALERARDYIGLPMRDYFDKYPNAFPTSAPQREDLHVIQIIHSALETLASHPPQPAVATVTVEELAEMIANSTGGYGYTVTARAILSRLGITPADAVQPMNHSWGLGLDPMKKPSAPAGEKGRTLGEACYLAWHNWHINNPTAMTEEVGQWKIDTKNAWQAVAFAVVVEFIARLDEGEMVAVIKGVYAASEEVPFAIGEAKALIQHLTSLAAKQGKEAGTR